MTKGRPRQLELPVMVDVNGRSQAATFSGQQERLHVYAGDTGSHKPASDDDRSVYKAISDNYFNSTAKQA